MLNGRASCVVRGACFALVLIGCKERPRPADHSATSPQPIIADTPAAADQPAVVSQPGDTAQSPLADKLDDGSGFYIPRTRIDLGTIERDSIVAFSLLQPASIVKADYTGQERVTQCRERVATQDTLHLLCIDPVLGTVTIDGHFLVPRVEDGVQAPTADDDLVDAMVTVTRSGKVRHAQRHRFHWRDGE